MSEEGEPKIKVLAGLPTYDGTRWNANAVAALHLASVDTFEIQSSLLASAFNRCWVEALNKRQANPAVTHFLLLHADVVPVEAEWFSQLWEEFEKNACQVLSVAIPIKNELGITSTALDTEDLWRPRRFTVTEILDRSVTWTDPKLLVNTGMLLVDFQQPWVEKVCFTINDKIHKPNGKWTSEVESEDWNFSRQCRALGVDVWVTRRVAVQHMGRAFWRNDQRWGKTVDPAITG